MAALRGRGAAWSLSLSLVIHDFAAFPDAKVSSAEILVAVGRDGWTLSRATWRVLNRTLQFLEISLPEGSTLEAVRAGGAAVKPGEKVVGGVTHILVPLSRMQPGDVSTTVDVYWSRRLTGTKPGGSIADLGELDIPEPKLYGFDVEQTFYTVRLPEGLSATFDGNMQPVDQAKIQLFKAEEGLRELERLNDVQSRGSFGQKVLATENYRSKRAEVEQTLAALERETRKVSQEEKLEKLRTKAGLLDETNAVQTESGLNLGEEGADKKQLLDQVQELAQNRRAQESFRGKSNVVTQSWARNSAAPQRQSEKQVEAGKSDDWRIAYLRLEAGNAPGQSAVTGGAATDDGGRAPNIGGAGGGSGGASWYRGATAIPTLRPEAKAGLLSLPVTVPETGQVFRFQKLDGGARLTVSVSGPGAGRGATAFFLFLLVVLGLVAFYRFRPHERYRAFAPSCLIAAGILLGILIPAGVLLVLSVLVVIAGGVWLYRAVRPAKEEVAEGA
jgi:hypothetical protein